MHVACLIPTIDRIGGAERQVILLAKGMATRGWRVTVIALLGSGNDSAEELRALGVSFLSLEMRKGLLDPRGWVRLHHWLESHQPDVVHAHLPHAALLARFSRLATPLRVLVETIHSPAAGDAVRRIAYRLSFPMIDVVTAVSDSTAQAWSTAGLAEPGNLSVIPNGIDFSRWRRNDRIREEARRQSGFVNEFVWLAVGRLDPVKDHATLLRAFSRLPTDSRLVLAGTGPLEPALRRLSCELAIAGRVTFLGFQDDVLARMQQADGFVLNSRWEGLPLSLIEACACELPAVITGTPGAMEVLPHPPVNPVPVGDPDPLASAMNTLMSLPEVKRRDLGIRERQLVSQRFSLERVLDGYEELYRDALAISLQPARWRQRPVSPEPCGSSNTGR